MGVDIYLMSVWERWGQAQPSWNRWDDEPFATVDELQHAATAVFDKARSSGGYFRNGYNAGDVMWAMGLSWRDDVGKMLDADGKLPIGCAKELIRKIEARPLTRERIAQHIFERLSDGCVTYSTGFTEYGPAPDLDEMSAILCKRRDELLVILGKSIELGEPLVCSL
jgi:hypothetical protein